MSNGYKLIDELVPGDVPVVLYDFRNEDIFEQFIVSCADLLTDMELGMIQETVECLTRDRDHWDDINNSLTREQQFNLQCLLGIPHSFPFTPMIAFDVEKHSKVLMMIALCDVGINITDEKINPRSANLIILAERDEL